jgi:hypothetical protein
MISKQATTSHPETKAQDQDRLKSAIRSRVLTALDEENRLGRVDVRALWGDYYRVNVLVGENPGCIIIASSYFIEADQQGNILQSRPPLHRRK